MRHFVGFVFYMVGVSVGLGFLCSAVSPWFFALVPLTVLPAVRIASGSWSGS